MVVGSPAAAVELRVHDRLADLPVVVAVRVGEAAYGPLEEVLQVRLGPVDLVAEPPRGKLVQAGMRAAVRANLDRAAEGLQLPPGEHPGRADLPGRHVEGCGKAGDPQPPGGVEEVGIPVVEGHDDRQLRKCRAVPEAGRELRDGEADPPGVAEDAQVVGELARRHGERFQPGRRARRHRVVEQHRDEPHGVPPRPAVPRARRPRA
jgi:hypothetical protein